MADGNPGDERPDAEEPGTGRPGGSRPGGGGHGGGRQEGAGLPLWGEQADRFFAAKRGGSGGGSSRAATLPGRRRFGPLAWTLVLLPALLLLGVLAATLYTEVLWFRSLRAERVFWTETGARLGLFGVFGLLTALVVWSSLLVAYRNRPLHVPDSPQALAALRYREAIEPFRRPVLLALPLVLGFFSGMAAQRSWRPLLLWWHAVPFGRTDPQFGHDIGFYVFDLPWYAFLVGTLQTLLITALVVAAVAHVVYGGLVPGRDGRTTRTALVHLSVLAACLVLVQALRYWLSRYELLVQSRGLRTGAMYTDVHAVIPTKTILAVAAVLCALMFLGTLWSRSWRLPIIGTVGLVAIAMLVGTAYPWAVQSFKVRPSEQSLEAEYVSRNIGATRAAYGLDDLEITPYSAKTDATPGQLRGDAETIPGIRLVDPSLVAPTFTQLQAVKSFYSFPETLDVDRYTLDGKRQDVVITVRELNLDGLQPGQRNWLNDHTVYTHGFGVVAARGNQRTTEGSPVFAESGIPSRGDLPEFEPRVYFGEQSPRYSLVGAPEGTEPRELDHPDSAGNGQKSTTYRGAGGVPLGSWFTRAAYATRYGELKFLLSDAVNPQTRILDHRAPKERVGKVAPWLTLDENVYPAVVGGRILWIVDGYTTSDRYPYAELASFGDATRDSKSSGGVAVTAQNGKVNYIRNAVKATVDAYDGTVTLYEWDKDDAVLQTWKKVFPGLVRPTSEISGDLMGHLRYPEDLFKVQRELLSHYHVTEPHSFYAGNEFWRVPEDPTVSGNKPQPPYYLSLAMPGQDSAAFSLTSTFIPMGSSGQQNNREVLSAFVAVDADAGTQPGRIREGYGKLRVLELPSDTTVKGPGQLRNAIESSNVTSKDFGQTLSQYLSLNRQQESQVQLGNLLTLPVGGGLLYVEPIYVSKKGSSSFPLLRLVVVAFGDRLAWASSLDGALDELFGGNSGANAGDRGQGSKETGPTPSPGPSGSASPSPSGTAGPSAAGTPDPARLKQAIADAQKAYQDGQAALKRGDWEAYGKHQKELQDALARAVAAQPAGGSTPSLSGGSSATTSSTTAPAVTSTSTLSTTTAG